MWRQFPLALSQRLARPVIAYDRLGFGRSSARLGIPSVRFVSEEAETYFPQLKERLGVGEFLAFGHSVGGAMAVLVGAKFSTECRAVITEAAQALLNRKRWHRLPTVKAGSLILKNWQSWRDTMAIRPRGS
jgi:pimeloyl-ACP methyl ester carboxylesterase